MDLLWLWLFLGYMVWFGVGIWWFIRHMGDKNRKEAWWEIIILAPIFPPAILLGLVSGLWETYDEWRQARRGGR